MTPQARAEPTLAAPHGPAVAAPKTESPSPRRASSRLLRVAADVVVFALSTALFYAALSLLSNPRNIVSTGQVGFFYGLF